MIHNHLVIHNALCYDTMSSGNTQSENNTMPLLIRDASPRSPSEPGSAPAATAVHKSWTSKGLRRDEAGIQAPGGWSGSLLMCPGRGL
jgi:hypothetical protein